MFSTTLERTAINKYDYKYMKKLMHGLIATVLFGFVGNAQEKSDFDSYFKSSNFSLMCKQHSFSLNNVDLNDFGEILHKSGEYKIYRVRVNLENKINYLTFFTYDRGSNFIAVFEKNKLEINKFEVLDENGTLYATFIANNIDDKQISFKINEVFEASSKPKKVPCISRVYKLLKDACASDETCDFLCDLNPSCTPMLLAWAATYCAFH